MNEPRSSRRRTFRHVAIVPSDGGADAAAWFTRATSRAANLRIEALLENKRGHRVSVVIPARNEAATIGGVVHEIRSTLVDRAGLVDELIVIDSDSRDDTAQVASSYGAVVHAARAIRPDLGYRAGKGEALWKSLFVTSGDLLVFIDADLTEWGRHFVTGMLGPLLSDDRVGLVKGFYDRLVDDTPDAARAPQGGRVTELVARPLINLRWLALSMVVQPLAGEWAIRRAVFEACSMPVGYGVEMATLLDVWAHCGLAAIAQVDLGERGHRHQSVQDLGVMVAEIMAVASRRESGPVQDHRTGPDGSLWQFHRRCDPPGAHA
jgi:glucosyl-3-phosphoglycerate synthase